MYFSTSLPFAPGAAPRPIGVSPPGTPADRATLPDPCAELPAGSTPRAAAPTTDIATGTTK